MISKPGPESDSIFLGQQMEDEVFGLPGGNYPHDLCYRTWNAGRLHHVGSARSSKMFGSNPQIDLIAGNGFCLAYYI